ncbi:hypothetical protein B0P06_003536 [Clostridium saccharoperbutylacetonicum]|uniref:Uncharacterized protein n=1 Tax=Clostridium saccharoperbutylacetonicum N1-4(HMT) TaxID=931276 RepID=M1N3W9_9CLOT|nr:hypothetical protein Cspa_c43990 [Clostridium saccharoperbutylacetonicum N1-4(HMT)]NRT61074.1 hypothetical protein [Clostridium saccharoperbutylacetonicum]NSB24389.1 hypothetical protein [Clostridium saccharoperbutylacetonicum]NSB43765.1 hypothetical protein [Clostridium saccharoperbutylacetonicum]
MYILRKRHKENIHIESLKLVLQENAKKREKINNIENHFEIFEEIMVGRIKTSDILPTIIKIEFIIITCSCYYILSNTIL